MNSAWWDYGQKQSFDRLTGIWYTPPPWWLPWNALNKQQQAYIGLHINSGFCMVDEMRKVAIVEILWRDGQKKPIVRYSDRNNKNDTIDQYSTQEQVFELGDITKEIVDGKEITYQLVCFWSNIPCRRQIQPVVVHSIE